MNMIDAIKNMSEWATTAMENQGEVHKACHAKGVDCSHFSHFMYSASEFKAIEQDMNRCVLRFLNAMKLLSVSGTRLSEGLGEDFDIPIPPINVVQFSQSEVHFPTFDEKEMN